ncbi:MFS transporter [Aeoliella sp. ICT_H6.2]|uniref:MFS transporter n=1 Tax=Aeoliella straminimaris TaxID=2954799 RepID=A0A9X2JIG4_9BACT|nr:MFS transporter [Aeoliella straminimaris]MCO6046811.1 MFS transporter [Aeoliella straminimaris]
MRYSDELPVDVEPYASRMKADPRERRDEAVNFSLLALHQILLRVGWIFKTESIVMPVFMSVVGGGPVLQACLVVLSRLGLSIPPVLFSRTLKIAHRKKWWYAGCSLAMAVPFGALAVLCATGWWQDNQGQPRWWMPAVYLVLYASFFALTGMNQLTAHALQGKLVRVERRGRLFTASVVVGSPIAIVAAMWWMPGWLASQEQGFAALFGCSAVLFALAGVATLFLREAPDDFRQSRSPLWRYFHHAWQVIEHDANARALAILTVLFSTSFMLFPHYVSAVTDGGAFDLRRMTLWVCMQNAGVAMFSFIAGPLADRYGNRAALHLTVAGATIAPLLVIAALLGFEQLRGNYSWLVFVPLGFTPVTIRFLTNYALEIASRHDHPKYISAIGLCMALPVVVGAPLVGLLAKWAGYLPVFTLGFVALLVALWQTFRIAEPRHGESSIMQEALK